jgi:hypothetical protein
MKHKRPLRIVTSLLPALLLAGMGLVPAYGDVITDWNAIATDTILGASPAERPNFGLDLTMVHIAIFDAENAIDRRYTTYIAQPSTSPTGASQDAAAIAAAYTVLKGNFPSRRAQLDAAYATSIAALTPGEARDRGIAVGTEVANAVAAWRAGDGRLTVVPPYVPGSDAGAYQLTPPAYAPPVNTYVPHVRPFALLRASQFRAYGPPNLTSERFARDFNETKRLGSATSTERTAAQTEIGLFHTENPTTFWSRNLSDFAVAQHLGMTDHARLLAQLYVALGDASIACFDSKYYYNFWRPITAIQTSLDDGNPATETDATWTPLANTPPHPEYPAAHGCVAGAVTETMQLVVGQNVHAVFTSKVAGTIPHTFKDPDALAEEIIDARVYGGMHYRNSVVTGVRLGRMTAEWVGDHYFKRVRKGGGR